MLDHFKTQVLDEFSKKLNHILKENNKRFINEGVIVFELSKCLTQLEKDKNKIAQNYPQFVDISIVSRKLYIEIKYVRGIPSNKHIPVTNKFGQLLNDMAKLAEKVKDGFRIVILVSDPTQIKYFQNKDPRFIGSEGTIINFDDLALFEVQSIKDKIKYDLTKIKVVEILRKINLGEFEIIVYIVNP